MIDTDAPVAADWHEANQRYTAAALGSVREVLEAFGAGRTASRTREGTPPESVSASDSTMALDHVVSVFRLTPFERDLLMLCAGMEMDAGFAHLCATAQHDAHRAFPTFGLALAALPEAHWSAITPTGPLRYWRLIDVGAGSGLTGAQLRIDERILHFLAGIEGIDERLTNTVEPGPAAVDIVPSHTAVSAAIVQAWVRSAREPAAPVVQLCGESASDKRAIAAHACRAAKLNPWVLPATAIPVAAGETEALARLWCREGLLGRHALLVECEDGDPADGTRADAIARFSARVRGPLLISSRDRRRLGQVPSMAFDVAKPTPTEQVNAWRGALGGSANKLNGQVDRLVSYFNLGSASIREAFAMAVGRATQHDGVPLEQSLWDACCAQARPRLDDLAQRLPPSAGWDDLVLPVGPRQLLHDLASHVRHRATVYEHWGFAKSGTRGLGVSALFAGASGTGKTMAAEVLAQELRLDLYRIDLSSVVSKYIGETEKNLRRIFDAAEDGGAILLFDEADALFGKRSEVKDSHDRYANIEVSYLLQRMEAYRGLAILTTNMRSALDTAFLRRIRFVVQFPFPDTDQRAEIWRRAFPATVPARGLAPELLAQLNVSGGNIRNIALGAAFLAAEAGEAVQMAHVLRAARTEYAKIEKPLTDAECAGWLS